MSAPAQSPAASAAHTAHTRRPPQHDDDEEQKQPAQPSAHGSPAMGLYRHALESIFAMLQLQDLSRALAVSRSWSAAVRSMKAIDATIERDERQLKRQGMLFRPLPAIVSLVRGPLLRHLAGIHVVRSVPAPLFNETLALLAQHAPNLTSLWCDLRLTDAPLVLPAKLTSLELALGDEYAGAAINAVLTALAALPALSRLILEATVDGVDLSLLAASRTLADFTLVGNHGDRPTLTDAQVDQIRSSLGNLSRFNFAFLEPVNLPRLLQPPHALCWQDIGFIVADAHTDDLLATLPTLTMLELTYPGDTPHADFLSKLPLLSVLYLDCGHHIPAAPLLASLLPCTGLTDLNLDCGFDSSQVSTLLAALTQLRILRLRCTMQSLQCFASGPVTFTLEDLHLERSGPAFPSCELVHLYALQCLRSLELDGAFESLDDAALASLTPPTALLPRLTRLSHAGEEFSTREERTGPSFEWMQLRLTQ